MPGVFHKLLTGPWAPVHLLLLTINFTQDYQSNFPFHQVSLLFKSLQWFSMIWEITTPPPSQLVLQDLTNLVPILLPSLTPITANSARTHLLILLSVPLLLWWLSPGMLQPHNPFCLFCFQLFSFTNSKPTYTHAWFYSPLSSLEVTTILVIFYYYILHGMHP